MSKQVPKKIDVWMIPIDGDAAKVVLRMTNVDSVTTFFASCDELGIEVSGTNLVALRSQVVACIRAGLNIQWKQYFQVSVEINSNAPPKVEYDDQYETTKLALQTYIVEIGTGSDGKQVWRYADSQTVRAGRPGAGKTGDYRHVAERTAVVERNPAEEKRVVSLRKLCHSLCVAVAESVEAGDLAATNELLAAMLRAVPAKSKRRKSK